MKQTLSGTPINKINFLKKYFYDRTIFNFENQWKPRQETLPWSRVQPWAQLHGLCHKLYRTPRSLPPGTFWVNVHWRPWVAAIYLFFLLQNKFTLFCLLSFNKAKPLTCYKIGLSALTPHPIPTSQLQWPFNLTPAPSLPQGLALAPSLPSGINSKVTFSKPDICSNMDETGRK